MSRVNLLCHYTILRYYVCCTESTNATHCSYVLIWVFGFVAVVVCRSPLSSFVRRCRRSFAVRSSPFVVAEIFVVADGVDFEVVASAQRFGFVSCGVAVTVAERTVRSTQSQ